jgi:hypothetical protein
MVLTLKGPKPFRVLYNLNMINFRRAFVIAALGALTIIYTALFSRMLTTPAEYTGSDFIAWYTGGRVADLWGSSNVYNLDYQQSIQAQVVGFELAPGQVLMFNHPPFLVPLLSLLADGNYLASMGRYIVIMVLIYAAGMAVVYRLLRLEGWERSPAWLMLAGMITFYPLFISLINAQDTALMVLGGFLWLLGMRQKKDVLAGLGLALTTVRPHIALLLVLPFLFRRRGVFWGFCLAMLGLGGISLLAVGLTGLEAFVHILLSTAGGEWFGVHESAMVDLVGLLTRLFPNGGTVIHWIGWGTYLVSMVALCVIWIRSRSLNERHFTLLVVCAVFFAPHLHYHDLTLLLVAFVAVLPALVHVRTARQQDAGPVLLACSLLLLLGSLVPVLKFNLPYLVMAWLLLTLWHPQWAFFWNKKGVEAA